MQEINRGLIPDGYGQRHVNGITVSAVCYANGEGVVAWNATVFERNGCSPKHYWIEDGRIDRVEQLHLAVPGRDANVVVMGGSANDLKPEVRSAILEAIAELSEGWIARGRPTSF